MSIVAGRQGPPWLWQVKSSTPPIVVIQRQGAAAAGLPWLSAAILLPPDTCGASGLMCQYNCLMSYLSAKTSEWQEDDSSWLSLTNPLRLLLIAISNSHLKPQLKWVGNLDFSFQISSNRMSHFKTATTVI